MRQYLLHALPGRAIIVGAAIKFVVWLVRAISGGVPAFLSVVDTVAGLAIAAGAPYFAFRLLVLAKRRALLGRGPQKDFLFNLLRLLAGAALRGGFLPVGVPPVFYL